jgi:CubicO group peptidase (beta-lactamase class C family)
MKKFFTWCFIIVGLLILGSCRQTDTPKKTPDVRAASHAATSNDDTEPMKSGTVIDKTAQKALNQALAHTGFSGAAIIVRNGQTIAQTSAGFADARMARRNTVDTTFEIDSIQKAMTGTLIMQQVQANKLRLNTPLKTFYPQIPGSDHITIRQLLDMTSGLSTGKFQRPEYRSDVQVVNTFIANTKYTSKMWNEWSYQPVNFVILCGILEKLTHRTYQQLFTQAFIDKLHLHNTHFAYMPTEANRAHGYYWDKKLQQANFKQPWNATSTMQHFELGTGQVFMSPHDLYVLESAMVSGRILGQRATDVLHWPGSRSTYAAGFYQHAGSMRSQGYGYGFEGFVRITPNGKNAVVVMANVQPDSSKFLKAADKLALIYAK